MFLKMFPLTSNSSASGEGRKSPENGRTLDRLFLAVELLSLNSDSSFRLLCSAPKGQTLKGGLQKDFLLFREVIGQTVSVLVPVCTPPSPAVEDVGSLDLPYSTAGRERFGVHFQLNLDNQTVFPTPKWEVLVSLRKLW